MLKRINNSRNYNFHWKIKTTSFLILKFLHFFLILISDVVKSIECHRINENFEKTQKRKSQQRQQSFIGAGSAFIALMTKLRTKLYKHKKKCYRNLQKKVSSTFVVVLMILFFLYKIYVRQHSGSWRHFIFKLKKR